MSSINNMTSKIIDDANNIAKQLIEDANNKENDLINKKILEAEKKKKIIISKAKSESKIRAQRIISNADLQVRNMKLKAKGEVLDKVFDIAIEDLNKISKSKFLKFMKESILSLDIDGDEEVIVGEGNNDVTPEFINELNKELKTKEKIGKLKLSSEKRKISGGYILSKKGIEINYTFQALVKDIRDDIEAEVAKTLFS